MNLKGCNFYEALCHINDEFGLCLGGRTGEKKVSYKKFKAKIIDKKCLIQFKPQHFTELDKQYWFQKYKGCQL